MVTWNRLVYDGFSKGNRLHGVPVATITYQADVGPHLQRALMYRRQRLQRCHALRQHDYRRYDEDDHDPYRWAKTDDRFGLLMEVVAIIFFAAGDTIFRWLKLDRMHGADGAVGR